MKYTPGFFDRLDCDREEKVQCVEIIDALIVLSEKSRRMGLLVLEDDIGLIDDAFLKKGLQLIVDGTDPEIVRNVLYTRMLASRLTGSALLRAVLILEGIMGIQAGDNPGILADKLSAFLGADVDLWDEHWARVMRESEAMDAGPDEYCPDDMPAHDDDGPELPHGEIRESVVNTVVDGIDFEKICTLIDRHIQKVLREVDTQDLAIALKGTSAELQGAIFRNMSPRASSLLREDMDFMGPVRREDVESRQEKILNIVIKLAECGDIIIPNGSEFIE